MSAAPISFTEIPIIDIGALVAEDASPESRQEAAERIGEACRDVGFFYIRNHGVPEAHREAMFDVARRFFALPLEEKMKLHIGKSTQFRGYIPMGGEITGGKRDWHECIDLQPQDLQGKTRPGHPLDDPEQWPAVLPEFREVMMRSWDYLYRVSTHVAAGMAASLGLEPTYFQQFAGIELCDLRLAHYPPADPTLDPSVVEAGMGAHCDLGFLAILQQDEVGGLEVCNADGQWIDAPHLPGAFLVNIGEMMQTWTNDRFHATLHRVRIPKEKDRFAIPFFFEPRYDTLVAPLAVCCDADHPPKYEAIRFGDYLTGRFSKAYKS